MPSRAALTSRWRSPNASLKRWPTRLRKQAMPSAEPSAAIEVICTSGSPQATTHVNGSRSLVTLTAKPCEETPWEMCTPTEAILRSPTHTPTCLWPSLVAAATPASPSAVTIERSIVRMYSGTLDTCMIG